MKHELTREPEFVFHSTRTGGSMQGRSRRVEWTCKKTAIPGDVYLFWFGGSVRQLQAVGVCDSKVEERTPGDWTSASKGWFCAFSPVVRLREPLTIDDIRRDRTLLSWWSQRPYQGRPKQVSSSSVAKRLVKLILSKNPDDPQLRRILSAESRSSDGEGSSQECERLYFHINDEKPPLRVRANVERVIRNTRKGIELKKLHDWRCQVCGVRLAIPAPGKAIASFHAEVHHVRPLGREHNGKDNWNNMLVLCPNCHAAFDFLAMAVDPVDMRIRRFGRGVTAEPPQHNKLRIQSEHTPSIAHLKYHFARCTKAWSNYRTDRAMTIG